MPRQHTYQTPKLYAVATKITERMKQAVDKRLMSGTFATVADYVRAAIETDLEQHDLL